jgi:hypothetical protein
VDVPSDDYELIAQKVSELSAMILQLENRLAGVEKTNTRLEEAALTTARALQEVSQHWDAVYEAMRRKDTTLEPPDGARQTS